METTSDSETETSNVEETQTNQTQSKDLHIINFLKFGVQEHGKHSIAIIKNLGDERGTLAATIYANYSGEPKRASYTAKDRRGEIIMTSPKLYEIEKHIKENAVPLLAQARQYKNAPEHETPENKKESIVEKEAKAIGLKIVEEEREIGTAALNVVFENLRNKQIKSIRHRKAQQKSKGHQR